MSRQIDRREFLEITAGGVAYFASSSLFAADAWPGSSALVSPGCRRSKVKVARLYMGTKGGHWPTPKLNFQEEMGVYNKEFAKLGSELRDVDFVVDELVTSAEQAQQLKHPVPVGDVKVSFTVKLSRTLVHRLRDYAASTGLTLSEIATRAFSAVLHRGGGRG